MRFWYQEFSINGITIGFYYITKTHRYLISLNYGEETYEVTEKQGEAIIQFLKRLKDFSKKSSTPKESPKEECKV